MKPFSRVYTDNDLAGTCKVADAVEIAASMKHLLAVAVPPEGYLERLLIVQTSGTSVGASLRIFQSSLPFPTAGDMAAAAAITGTDGLYDLLASISITSGQLSRTDWVPGRRYQNLDGSPTRPQGTIYLLITPTGAGTTTKWDILLQGYTDSRF